MSPPTPPTPVETTEEPPSEPLPAIPPPVPAKRPVPPRPRPAPAETAEPAPPKPAPPQISPQLSAKDLETARELLAPRSATRGAALDVALIGVNCRDLQSLNVLPERFEILAPRLPAGWPAVAESGVASPADAARMRRLGYRLALIGTALMICDDPGALLRDILAAARTSET